MADSAIKQMLDEALAEWGMQQWQAGYDAAVQARGVGPQTDAVAATPEQVGISTALAAMVRWSGEAATVDGRYVACIPASLLRSLTNRTVEARWDDDGDLVLTYREAPYAGAQPREQHQEAALVRGDPSEGQQQDEERSDQQRDGARARGARTDGQEGGAHAQAQGPLSKPFTRGGKALPTVNDGFPCPPYPHQHADGQVGGVFHDPKEDVRPIDRSAFLPSDPAPTIP